MTLIRCCCVILLLQCIKFDISLGFTFRRETLTNRLHSTSTAAVHNQSFCIEASIDERKKDVCIQKLDNVVSAREWMEHIERQEGQVFGVGAYTVLRCDATYAATHNKENDTDVMWNIWGLDFHLDRLYASYEMLLKSQTHVQVEACSESSLEGTRRESQCMIRTMLADASKSAFGDRMEEQLYRTLMLTILWTPTNNDINKPIYLKVRGHASFAGATRCTLQDEMLQPVSACLAIPEELTLDALTALPHRYNGGATEDDETKSSVEPNAKISSWCQIRRPLEDPTRYKRPDMNAGEVLLLNQCNYTAQDFIESLEVLEGLTSNFFVIYKDGVVRTAPSTKVLPGYSRCLVLKALQQMRSKATTESSLLLDERAPTVKDATDGLWSEVFITSAIRLVIPVSRVLMPATGTNTMKTIWQGGNFSRTEEIRVAEFRVGLDESLRVDME